MPTDENDKVQQILDIIEQQLSVIESLIAPRINYELTIPEVDPVTPNGEGE